MARGLGNKGVPKAQPIGRNRDEYFLGVMCGRAAACQEHAAVASPRVGVK